VVIGSMNRGGLDGTIEACAQAVSELAAQGLLGMVEPLPYHREEDGTLRLRKDAPLARAVTVGSALGTTSAHICLKMPSCEDPVSWSAAPTPQPGPKQAPGGRPVFPSPSPVAQPTTRAGYDNCDGCDALAFRAKVEVV
jgi:hypothetical protein